MWAATTASHGFRPPDAAWRKDGRYLNPIRAMYLEIIVTTFPGGKIRQKAKMGESFSSTSIKSISTATKTPLFSSIHL
jgi:hypothetical protein